MIKKIQTEDGERLANYPNQVSTTQEAAQTTNKPTQYTVSPNTAMFLDLLNSLEEVYNSIYSAIEELCGSCQADSLFDKDFYPILSSLQEAIFKYVQDSIMNNRKGNII